MNYELTITKVSLCVFYIRVSIASRSFDLNQFKYYKVLFLILRERLFQ